MRKIDGAVAAISGIFGFIAFAICVFLVPPWLAMLFGLFTAGLFIVVLSIVLYINDRKYKNIDDEISEDILLKETANHYEGTHLNSNGGKQIHNGALFLTRSRLVFISREKKREFRLDVPINTIETAVYGKDTTSFVIATHDGNSAGFIVKNAAWFLGGIRDLMKRRNGVYLNETALHYACSCRDELSVTAESGEILLTRVDLGQLTLPTGKIVANHPCVCFEFDEFTTTVKPGSYPVSIFIAKMPSGDKRVALAILAFSGEKAIRWEMALVKNQSIDGLKDSDDGYFGYGADSGTGGFMDKQTADKISERTVDIYELFQAQFDSTYVDTYNYAIGSIDGNEENDAAAFSSGWGDGCYPSYFGFDESGELCALVTDFLILD